MTDINKELSNFLVKNFVSLQDLIIEKYKEAPKQDTSSRAVLPVKDLFMYLDLHLAYIVYAIRLNNKDLLRHYINWIKTIFFSRKIPVAALLKGNLTIRMTLLEAVPEKYREILNDFLELEEKNMDNIQISSKSLISEDNPYYVDAKKYLSLLLERSKEQAFITIVNLIKRGVDLKDIYLNIFQPAQNEVGRLWELNEISVAQEHFTSAATQSIIAYFFPEIFKVTKRRLTLIAASVGNELHEIGIRMIADFFEMNGWNTIYLGANTPSIDIINEIEKVQPEVVALSATMMTHVIQLEELISNIIKTNSSVKIIVGGYPFNLDPRLSQEIDADGYAMNASDAIKLAEVLISKNLNH